MKLLAKISVRPRKNTAEGGWGEFRGVLAKNRGQARRLPEALRPETSKNIFFSLIIEKNGGGTRKSGKAKKTFLPGGEW